MGRLLALESVTAEFECAAVFSHRPYGLFWCAIRQGHFNLEGHGDLGSDLSREMGNHLVGDAARIAADAGKL